MDELNINKKQTNTNAPDSEVELLQSSPLQVLEESQDSCSGEAIRASPLSIIDSLGAVSTLMERKDDECVGGQGSEGTPVCPSAVATDPAVCQGEVGAGVLGTLMERKDYECVGGQGSEGASVCPSAVATDTAVCQGEVGTGVLGTLMERKDDECVGGQASEGASVCPSAVATDTAVCQGEVGAGVLGTLMERKDDECVGGQASEGASVCPPAVATDTAVCQGEVGAGVVGTLMERKDDECVGGQASEGASVCPPAVATDTAVCQGEVGAGVLGTLMERKDDECVSGQASEGASVCPSAVATDTAVCQGEGGAGVLGSPIPTEAESKTAKGNDSGWIMLVRRQRKKLKKLLEQGVELKEARRMVISLSDPPVGSRDESKKPQEPSLKPQAARRREEGADASKESPSQRKSFGGGNEKITFTTAQRKKYKRLRAEGVAPAAAREVVRKLVSSVPKSNKRPQSPGGMTPEEAKQRKLDKTRGQMPSGRGSTGGQTRGGGLFSGRGIGILNRKCPKTLLTNPHQRPDHVRKNKELLRGAASIRHPFNHQAPAKMPPFNNAPISTSRPFNHGPPANVSPFTNPPASTSHTFNHGPRGIMPPCNSDRPGNMMPFTGGHYANSHPMPVGMHQFDNVGVASFSGGYSKNVQRINHGQRQSTEPFKPPAFAHPTHGTLFSQNNMAHNVHKYPNNAPQQESCSTDLDEDPTTPLFIVPTGYPGERFSDEEMDAIESGILEAILEIDDDSLKPTFQESLRDNGRYGVICNDQLSKMWLSNFLTSWQPWQSVSFKVVRPGRPKLKAFAKLPLCANDEDDKILKFIAKQNSNINASQWEVIKRMDSETSTCLILYIDEESAKVLVKDRTIHFKIGRAEIIVEEGFKGSNDAGRTLTQHRQESEDRLSHLDHNEQPPWVKQHGLGQNNVLRGPSSSDQPRHLDELSQPHYNRPPWNSFSRGEHGKSQERPRFSCDPYPKLLERPRFISPSGSSLGNRHHPSFEARMRQPEPQQQQTTFPVCSGFIDFDHSSSH